MSYPYVTDLANALLGTRWHLPLPTFGVVVALAVVIASAVAVRAVRESERLGRLPPATHAMVTDMVLVAMLAGIIGARVFDILDHFGRFRADPLALIFTRSGFSIYGGLCFGVLAGVLYVRRRAVPVLPMLDAAAPALMLGYGIGRIGCQLSGDGDWGVASDLFWKPHWLPTWFWAQTYEGNITGAVIAPPGVYPTPIYETALALALFGVLWALRSHGQRAGFLFAMYLLLAGFERLVIEKIRINTRYALFGLHVTQAEVVSMLLICAGLIGVVTTLRRGGWWSRLALSATVLAALSACAPH